MLRHITYIHQELLNYYKLNTDQHLVSVDFSVFSKSYDVTSFLHELQDSGARLDLGYLTSGQSMEAVLEILINAGVPVLMFVKEDNRISPVLVSVKENKMQLTRFYDERDPEKTEYLPLESFSLFQWISYTELFPSEQDRKGDLLVATCFPLYHSNVNEDTQKKELNPWKRLWKLLHSERQEVFYIYFYSIIGSILSLTLPLGVQAIIGLVSSGEVPTSVLVLIGIIVIGLLFTGGIQLMQIKLMEHIQQKVFAKTAFEFAYRIPKLRIESVLRQYTPELMNRFFDIMTLQKGLSKLLVDFTAVTVQIVLGLILLSLYHFYFLFFGLLLILVLYLLLSLTAKSALVSSLKESKYKYMVANWLEEIARALSTFKLAGYSPIPMAKTDNLVSHYLYARQSHFKILVIQYVSFILFKTIITGGLLVLGCILVINQEINIGQFVASEIVIILVMNGVEKLIVQLDTIYDLLTSLEKIGGVMDLPIETAGGITVKSFAEDKGLEIKVRNLRYKYPFEPQYILKGIDLDINAGERVCLTGYSSSGKTTFINILLGFLSAYDGVVAVNGINMKQINKNSLIDQVGDNISQEDLFDGTILENITLGRTGIMWEDVQWAVESVGLSEYLQEYSDGLHTHLPAGNLTISESIARKIILARSIVKKPKLLILEDFLFGFEKDQKLNFLSVLFKSSIPWTVLLVSSDPDIMKLCDRTVILKGGIIIREIKQDDMIRKGI